MFISGALSDSACNSYVVFSVIRDNDCSLTVTNITTITVGLYVGLNSTAVIYCLYIYEKIFFVIWLDDYYCKRGCTSCFSYTDCLSSGSLRYIIGHTVLAKLCRTLRCILVY